MVEVKKISIQQKLESLGFDPNGVVMGDFDYIGRFTAERQRSHDDPNYKKYGAFYRSNYERGILIYHLIRAYDVESVLEIGYGRGYSTFCAAKAFHDSGVNGTITTVDPALTEESVKMLGNVFPKEWFKYVKFMKGTSAAIVPQLQETFDLVYIDGDHSFEATKADWEMTKDKWNKCLLFDDYHLPTKVDAGIQCRDLIDTIDDPSKELIVMDRRMFFDDRRFTDDQIDYGQVLLTKPEAQLPNW